MSDFAPGIASMKAAGIPVTIAPYAAGSGGIRQSLDAMALKMREGRIDAAVIGHVGQVLQRAGLDGRSGRTTDAKRVAALLDDLRATTVYAPDAYGAEVIQSAAGTMCLRPGLCLNRGDCDDLSVALGSMTLSLGIPTQIVKQSFGADAQEHVLIAVYVDGDWKYADPSTNMAFGSALAAQNEVWVDPMEAVGNVPEASPQIVTLGRPGGLAAGAQLNPQASPTSHWIGTGAILGYPMIDDLVALRAGAKYQLDQLQAAATACPGGFDNAIEWTFWQRDFAQLQTDFANVSNYVDAYIGDQPEWTWKFSAVFYPWDLVRGIMDTEADLDRRWREFGGTKCAPPVYPNMPQPATDPDLVVMQAADTALKTVKSVADNAASPATIGAGGVVIGVLLAMGAVIAVDHFLPARR